MATTKKFTAVYGSESAINKQPHQDATMFMAKNGKIFYDDTKGNRVLLAEKNPAQFVHNQQVASTEWAIQHNLGKFPTVTIVDSGNTVVVGDIQYIDENNLKCIFNYKFSGKAYLN